MLLVGLARANDVVIEIDPAAEGLLDARVARRLVSLELSDVSVPGKVAGAPPALFFRVLGRPDRQLRVELWERGELHDVRMVAGVQGASGHLLARRVALAAAELARRLRQKHQLARQRQKRELEQLRQMATLAARRTREGPLALRPEWRFSRARNWWTTGPSLAAEVSLSRSLRLDLDVRQNLGADDSGRGSMSFYELGLAPAWRLHPSDRIDLDLTASAAAVWAHFPRSVAIDAIDGRRSSFTARASAAVRLEPRLGRALRASVGVEGGAYLRPIPVTFRAGERARYGGGHVAVTLGVVLTPL